MSYIFSDRKAAGQLLADKLIAYANNKETLVLALPRGGVPVGFVISQALHIPLDLFLVRKIGAPFNKEFAIGAIALGDVQIFNQAALQEFNITQAQINTIVAQEQLELTRRNQLYRHHKPLPAIKNKTIILVDDGVATGATMQAALLAIKKMQPAKIILAVPVGPNTIYEDFKSLADEIICLETPSFFSSVGQSYRSFAQISDQEVLDLLALAERNIK